MIVLCLTFIADEAKPLGVGTFGSVYKAVLTKGGESSIVAVKSVQNGRDASYFKSLLEEFSVSAYLGTHSNVVKFVGTCTELLAQRKLYLVMEFCAFGSMDEFLKAKRSLFTSFVENGCWCGEPGYRSDSWSFACTIWEIFSLAEIPFIGCTWDKAFVDSLKSGELRLERPSQATHELYALMMQCWSVEPHMRPCFSRMSLQLGEMVLKYSTAKI
ncbi:Platelet-derived growth factor receptor alpha [Orchesella cincta]|uniref:Platelet-derived growth factor receptor alpha n=1 Tax=Orchesella cincta TaxID=48709 RepID=A0A1D2NJE0_ORCCI|nr:Platelet-derived growth factor receptor alpha [Orchesella cincta]